MSSEVENNKDEKVEEPPRIPLRKKILNQWQIGIKLLELIIAAISLGFIFEPVQTTGMGKSHLHHVGIMYTSYAGSMVTILCLLISKILRDKISFKTSFVFSIVNAALYLTTGILFTADKSDLTKDHFFHPSRYLLNMLTISLVTTFLNVIVFIIDAIITFKRQEDF